jgi:hypothetical protein
VAVATVRGVKGVRVALADPKDYASPWIILDGDDAGDWAPIMKMTDIRPLVVLDFRDWTPECPRLVAEWIRGRASDHNCPSGSAALMVAQEIEAQTKPPRIPEPEQFGVVVASCPCDQEAQVNWVLISGVWLDRGGDRHGWDSLIDPVLIREGLS